MVFTEDPAALERSLQRRRVELAAAWAGTDAVVAIGAGELIPRPGGADLTYPFQAHSEYLYLTDRNRPGGVLVFDPADGWTDFVAPVTPAEVLWSGTPAGSVDGEDLAGLDGWLQARGDRPLALLGTAPPALISDDVRARELRYDLNSIRRRKDGVELARIRAAAAATAAGFAETVPRLRAGATEREIQLELESAFLRAGADAVAFDTIVGAGADAAVLHFAPGQRRLADGEVVLIDAGAEVRHYVSDVTRTYPVGGGLDAAHAEWHAVVRAAQLAAIELCTVGVEWLDVHQAAAAVLASGLIEFGLLHGDPEELVDSGAIRLFFPHGIGHLVGIGVRDAAGPLRERETGRPGLTRIDLPLEPGHVVTVEPGLYIVPALLTDPEHRARYSGAVDFARAEAMAGFGGIRIEDNIHVTAGGPENLTAAIPLL